MVTRRENGSSMLLAMAALLVVTMAVLLVAQLIQNRVAGVRLEERQVVTGSLADAALAETLARLDDDRFFRGLAPQDLGGGQIESSVSILHNDRRRVVATGRVNDWRMSLTAEVDMRLGRPRVLRWSYQSGPGR